MGYIRACAELQDMLRLCTRKRIEDVDASRKYLEEAKLGSCPAKPRLAYLPGRGEVYCIGSIALYDRR